MGVFNTQMIDLTKTEPYLMARRAQTFLKDSLLWFDTFAKNEDLKKQILDFIRQDQLTKKGVDSNDEVIGFYSFTTSRRDSRKRFNTHYTLDDTGEFYRSMFIITLRDSLIIEADSAKIEDQEWWRDQILGLNEESLQKLREAYKRNAQDYLTRVLAGRV